MSMIVPDSCAGSAGQHMMLPSLVGIAASCFGVPGQDVLAGNKQGQQAQEVTSCAVLPLPATCPCGAQVSR